jgi:hypothetical protein
LAQIAHASAVSQIARSAFFLTVDPEAEGGLDKRKNHARLLAHEKANLTVRGATLRYRIEERLLLAEDGQPEVNAPCAVRDSTSELDYLAIREQLRVLEQGQRDKPLTATQRAEAWLADFLSDEEHDRDFVLAAGVDEGHAKRTLERAATNLRVQTTRRVDDTSLWRLSKPSRQPETARESWRFGVTAQPSQMLGVTAQPSGNESSRAHGNASFLWHEHADAKSPVTPTATHEESWREPFERVLRLGDELGYPPVVVGADRVLGGADGWWGYVESRYADEAALTALEAAAIGGAAA